MKSIYGNTVSCVRVSELCIDWFSTSAGVRQGDNLSPTLFALFINDLAKERTEKRYNGGRNQLKYFIVC